MPSDDTDFSQAREDYLNEFIDTKAAAKLLGFAPETLATWRCRMSRALKYSKIGRAVRYRRGNVLAFSDQQARHNTSEQPEVSSTQIGAEHADKDST